MVVLYNFAKFAIFWRLFVIRGSSGGKVEVSFKLSLVAGPLRKRLLNICIVAITDTPNEHACSMVNFN